MPHDSTLTPPFTECELLNDNIFFLGESGNDISALEFEYLQRFYRQLMKLIYFNGIDIASISYNGYVSENSVELFVYDGMIDSLNDTININNNNYKQSYVNAVANIERLTNVGLNHNLAGEAILYAINDIENYAQVLCFFFVFCLVFTIVCKSCEFAWK